MGHALRAAASALALAGFALTSSCATSLESVHSIDGRGTGHDYNLLFTRFNVTITRRLLSCDASSFRASVKVAIEAASADDGAHQYHSEQSSLRQVLNTTVLRMENFQDSHALKSVNVEVHDQSVPVIQGIVGGVGRLIRLGALGTEASGPSVCTHDIADAVTRAKDGAAAVSEQTDHVEDLTAQVGRLRIRRAELGETPAGARVAAQLLRAEATLQAASDALDAAQTALTRAVGPITNVEVIHFPEASNVFASGPLRVAPSVAAGWFTNPSNEALLSHFDVYLQIERSGSAGLDPLRATSADIAAANAEPSEPGIRYRNAEQGRLVACDIAACTSTTPAHVLQAYEGPIGQLGAIGVLRVRAHAFESMIFSATFSRDGSLISSGYERPTAAGASVQSIASSVVSEAEATHQAQESAQQTQLDAQLKQLQSQVAIAAAQRALQPNPNDQLTDATTAASAQAALYNAETSVLQAQIARLQAQNQLSALNHTD